MPEQVQVPNSPLAGCNCASCELLRRERRLRSNHPFPSALLERAEEQVVMGTKPIPSRRNLVNFTINGTQLEFWLEGVADIWVCKGGKYHDGRWKICGIVDGSFVRYPGLPLGIGIRVTTEGKIVEVP